MVECYMLSFFFLFFFLLFFSSFFFLVCLLLFVVVVCFVFLFVEKKCTIHENFIFATGCQCSFFSMGRCRGPLWLEWNVLHDTREICWFVLAIHEKSAGFYLQYTRNEFTLLAVSGHFSVWRAVAYPCGLKHTPRYTRNLLVCIHDTLEICWFVSTINEKSARLYLQYTRIKAARLCLQYTRNEFTLLAVSGHFFSMEAVVYPCGLKHTPRYTRNLLVCIHDTLEICWFVSTIH